MCGIVAYLGDKQAWPVLIKGLKRLEYRGYDSSGVAIIEQGVLCVTKKEGKVINLEEYAAQRPIDGSVGIGSDATPILEYTKQVIYPKDDEMVILKKGSIDIRQIQTNEEVPYLIRQLDYDLANIEKGEYEHYMLKEIMEQPSRILDRMRGRLQVEKNWITLGGIREHPDEIANAKRLVLIACGTSYHSALVAKYLFEDICNIPTDVDYASEFRYRNVALNDKSVVIGISQSGETADTIVALEGALKLKEISYIHSENYPAAEMKHGPIALGDENLISVFIATADTRYEKTVSNMQEIKARGGKIIAVTNQGDHRLRKMCDYTFEIPGTDPMLSPLVNIIPLQLLSYYTAIRKGCNVDQPRNLAKSVTVE